MLRLGLWIPLFVVVAAGCGDLTKVPPPPVPLGVVDVPHLAVEGAAPLTVAPGRIRLVNAVSPTALCTIHLPDLRGTSQRMANTSLARLLNSDAMAKMLTPLTLAAGGLSLPGGTGGATGLPAGAGIGRTLDGEVVLSVEELDFDGEGNPVSARLLAGVSVPGAEQQMEQLIAMVETMVAGNPETRVEKGSQDNTAFSRLVFRKPLPCVVEVALHDEALLVGLGRDTVTRAITRLVREGDASLAGNTDFHRAMQRCASEQDALRIHVDLAGLFQRIGPHLPAGLRVILDVAGLEDYRRLSSALRVEGKDLVVTSFLEAREESNFLTSLLATHPVDRIFFDWIPAEANSFSLFSIDANVLLARLSEKLPPDVQEDLSQGLAAWREAGIDVSGDVLSAIGPRCALVTLPYGHGDPRGLKAIWNHFLGTALLVEVRDPDATKDLLARLPAGDAAFRRRDFTVDGIPAVAYDSDAGQLPPGFAVCCTRLDDYLAITLCEETLAKLVRHPHGQASGRLRELTSEAPESVVMLSYDDMQKGITMLADAVVSGVEEELRAAGSPTELPAPDFAEVVKDFHPAVSYASADRRGLLFCSRSPTGGLGATGGLSGMLVLSAVAIPNFTLSRIRSNEEAALAMLRTIHTAQETYVSRVSRDTDGDGKGEHAYLCELLGTAREGGDVAGAGTPLVTGLAATEEGEFLAHGYYFRVYLPAEDGSPLPARKAAGQGARVDGDLAETILSVVAWPVSRGKTGRRSFVMDAAGTVLACVDGPYGGETPPPPDILSSQRGNLAAGTRTSMQPPWDGFSWVPARD